MSGEAASRARIDLPGQQAALAAAVLGAGRPVIVLLFSGRPLVMPEVFDAGRRRPRLLVPRQRGRPRRRGAPDRRGEPLGGPGGHLAARRGPGPDRLFRALRAGGRRTRTTTIPASTSTCPTRRSSPSATGSATPASPWASRGWRSARAIDGRGHRSRNTGAARRGDDALPLHPRSGGERRPAGPGAQAVREGRARRRGEPAGPVQCSSGTTSPSSTPALRPVVEPGRFEVHRRALGGPGGAAGARASFWSEGPRA